MSTYRAAEPLPTVTLGPLPSFPRRLVIIPFVLLLPVVMCWLGAVFIQVYVSNVPAELRCRRDAQTITCELWFDGKVQKTTKGSVEQIDVTTTKTRTRTGTSESVCVALAGEAVVCHDTQRIAARMRALQPAEELVIDETRKASNPFLFLAPLFTVVVVLFLLLLWSRTRERRRTLAVVVTPRTLNLPTGPVERVAREHVRVIFLERAMLPRQAIQYGDGERWYTLGIWRSYAGELDGFAAGLQACLRQFPRAW